MPDTNIDSKDRIDIPEGLDFVLRLLGVVEGDSISALDGEPPLAFTEEQEEKVLARMTTKGARPESVIAYVCGLLDCTEKQAKRAIVPLFEKADKLAEQEAEKRFEEAVRHACLKSSEAFATAEGRFSTTDAIGVFLAELVNADVLKDVGNCVLRGIGKALPASE